MAPGVVRFAVVGTGWETREQVLPAFASALRARLATVVCADGCEAGELAARHLLQRTWSLDEYDACLASGAVDAVYLSGPPETRRDRAVRATRAGIHVLCERPLAGNERDGAAIVEAARKGRVKLMVADRVCFDPVCVGAVETAESGVLGEVQSLAVLGERGMSGAADWTRTARLLYGDGPVEAMALSVLEAGSPGGPPDDPCAAAALRFPGGRVASYVPSHGSAGVSQLVLVGTRGELVVERAFRPGGERVHRVVLGGAARERRFPPRDPVARLLEHFAACVLEDRAPEASGEAALGDVRVLCALARSARTRRLVRVPAGAPARAGSRNLRRANGDAQRAPNLGVAT